jgi:hypothetical protein
MILISHRGNISGVLPEKENSPEYIDLAIRSGYSVEMDVRLIGNNLFLGHDTPDYPVTIDWLIDRTQYLFVHTKNFGALSHLIDSGLKTFYHQREAHTIINNCNLIWSHNLAEANWKSIIPLLSREDFSKFNGNDVAGICSDFIEVMR